MNLHANAALSWSGRRRLCELVVDEVGPSSLQQQQLESVSVARESGSAVTDLRALQASAIAPPRRGMSRTALRPIGSRQS